MEKRRLLPRTNSAAGHLSSPFSENNTSPLRRKSISFVPPASNKKSDIAHNETPNSSAQTSSPLRRSFNASTTPTPSRKSAAADTVRRLQKQSSGDDYQNRGLWPSSKKLNPSADTDADVASAPVLVDRVSTFSSRQRDPPSGDRGLRYQMGKLHVERSLKKPGTPPSPSTACAGPPPPFAPTHSRRLSFSDAGQSLRVSRAAIERPVSRQGSPAKGKSGGVGGMISQGFTNLFRRKSFQGEHMEATGRGGSPGKVKGTGSPARESISTARVNGTPSRGAAGVEGEVQQRLRMLHNHLIQWRFMNAGMGVVNETKKVNAQRMLMSAWVALSESRFSVAKKRAQLEKERLKFKLNSLLLHQTKGLERWSAVERHHLAALTSTENSLQAVVCRLPITGHAKVDPNSLVVSLQQATNVADAINGTIAEKLPRAQSTVRLVAELAQVVAREKLLLEECIELLGLSSSLHIHEESLRSHAMQIKAEKLMGSHGERSGTSVLDG